VIFLRSQSAAVLCSRIDNVSFLCCWLFFGGVAPLDELSSQRRVIFLRFQSVAVLCSRIDNVSFLRFFLKYCQTRNFHVSSDHPPGHCKHLFFMHHIRCERAPVGSHLCTQLQRIKYCTGSATPGGLFFLLKNMKRKEIEEPNQTSIRGREILY